MSDTLPNYVFIVGATATGKSDFALRLAQKLNWPIINCDSVQVYKKVDIGTAKPSIEDRSLCEHYLFDYVDPPNSLTAADYVKDVVELIEQENIQDAIFVGGSGFYIQALEKGLYPESEPSTQVMSEVNKMTDEDLFCWIEEKDPEFSKKISPNDHYRLKRSVAVMKTQNLTMTELKNKMASENHSQLRVHNKFKIGFNDERSHLRLRVTKRTEKMLSSGFIDEVKSLKAEGLDDWSPLQSVGYKEVQLYLDGEIKISDLPERIVTSTMQLIKKQQTWFKRDAEIKWFKPGESEEALSWLESQLN